MCCMDATPVRSAAGPVPFDRQAFMAARGGIRPTSREGEHRLALTRCGRKRTALLRENTVVVTYDTPFFRSIPLSTARSFFSRTLLAMSLVSAVLAGPAEARRGGSFGSRGSRTYSAPRSTQLAPGYTAPVQRSMTERPVQGSSAYAPASRFQPAMPQQRPGLFRGFGGGLLTGLAAGGLMGYFFGHSGGGFGGGAGGGGLLPLLIQLALIGGVVWLLFRLFRGNRPQPDAPVYREESRFVPDNVVPMNQGYAAPAAGDDIALSGDDQQSFERLLLQLQDAFSREDYARLREITTPEVMSYLAEELGENATRGRRNEVSGTHLLDGEISEAWAEQGRDYATIAMRYESADVMRDRTTGAVLSGDPRQLTQTTELWTFVRPQGDHSASWKVSAIQDA
jgi:predicted lipid-binding transport protein (Tim44 family)